VYYFGHNPGRARSGSYCGLIGERQLRFMRNLLAHVPADNLIVLSMHIPLATYQDPTNPADNTADRLALLELLKGRRHAVSFSGHMHLTEHHYLAVPGSETKTHHHHVLAAASGSWWGGPVDRRGIPFADSADGNPNGYHVLSVDGCRYTTRFVPAAGKAAGALRAVVRGLGPHGTLPLSDTRVAALTQGDCRLFVNVFDGGPRTQVTCEIGSDGSRRISLQRAPAVDPFIADLFERTAAQQKPWVRPVRCPHLWSAPLCSNLSSGTHRLTLRAIDEYGREQTAHMMLEVSAADAASSP
jgi:hypothetical protein